MKINYLIKAIPFLSTLLLVFFLSFNNQKQETKLRILIWNSPSLSLGTYIAISTGVGFVLSYIMTNKLANLNKLIVRNSIQYKVSENNKVITEDNKVDINASYENTLIERDIKDPSPTLNATFRVIGIREATKSNFTNEDNFKSNQYEHSNNHEEEEEEYFDRGIIDNQNKKVEGRSLDWNDESFLSW